MSTDDQDHRACDPVHGCRYSDDRATCPTLSPRDRPIPKVLVCPACSVQHVDIDVWATRVHRKHLCAFCGHLWKPFDYPTVGVLAVEKSEPLQVVMFFDFETCGLDSSTTSPLEMCARMCLFCRELPTIGVPYRAVWPLPEDFAKQCDAKVVDMHTRNGLFGECLQKEQPPSGAEFERWMDVCVRGSAPHANPSATVWNRVNDGSIVVYLGGRNIERFDRIILERVFPELSKLFHYRVLDVQFARMAARALGAPDRFDIAGESKHRALDDVNADIATARAVYACLGASGKAVGADLVAAGRDMLAREEAAAPSTKSFFFYWQHTSNGVTYDTFKAPTFEDACVDFRKEHNLVNGNVFCHEIGGPTRAVG